MKGMGHTSREVGERHDAPGAAEVTTADTVQDLFAPKGERGGTAANDA